jgi:VWFA-related protein
MSRFLLACGVLSLATALVAQQPVFRAGTDYVRVDVVVTDKADKPIPDLTKDDFVIEEHGRAQTIDAFQFVSVPLEHRTIDVTHPDPPADVATNLPRSDKSRLFVIVIDDLHILEQDVIAVKRIMTEFFQALSPDDEVAVVFTGRSDLSQNFTSDPARLMKTVDHVRDALAFGLDALGRPNASNVVAPDPKLIESTARRADIVLTNVAKSLAGSGHSRRAMVYVSTGSVAFTTPHPQDPPPPDDFYDLQEVYDMARRSNVPIYTIDPRGQAQPEDAVRGGISAVGNLGGGVPETLRALIADNIVRQQNRLAENAVNTGGRAFTNQSNLTKAVDEIVADNGSYYLLGYYPSPFAADGKFHDVKVHVNRPGTIVRARQGYVASAPNGASIDAPTSLDAAMSAGVNVSGIALRAFAAPLAAASKGMTTAITVEVTYPGRPADARRIDDELQISVMALDEDAKVKASSTKTLRFSGTAPDDRPITFFVDDAIDLPSQPLTLRVGVASRTLGKAGTVQVPIEAPKISDKLQIGGVALAVAGPIHEAALNGTAIAQLVPFQPTTSRVFSSGDTLRVFARAFWGSKDTSATATISAPGTSIASKNATLTTSSAGSGKHQGTIDLEFPLGGLAAGRYTLTIDVRSASGQTAQRLVPFEVR